MDGMLEGEWPPHDDQEAIYLNVILVKYTRVTLLLLADPVANLLNCTTERKSYSCKHM